MRRFVNAVGTTVEAAVRSFKTTGAVRTAQRALQRVIPGRIFDVNVVAIIEASIEITLDQSKGKPSNRRLRHRWATEQDLDLLTCGGLTPAAVQKYFDAGGRAVLTTMDGKTVGYYWAVPDGWVAFGWLRLTVAANEFWGGHNFVAPAYRGNRIAGEIRDFAYAQLHPEGYERSVGSVEILNRSSLSVWSGKANRVLGQVFYVRFVDLIIYRIGAKWGAGFYGGGRPLEFPVDAFGGTDPPVRPVNGTGKQPRGNGENPG